MPVWFSRKCNKFNFIYCLILLKLVELGYIGVIHGGMIKAYIRHTVHIFRPSPSSINKNEKTHFLLGLILTTIHLLGCLLEIKQLDLSLEISLNITN